MLHGLGAATAWSVLQRNGEALQARFEARKDVAREVERFRQRAAEIGSIDELMKDRRTLTFVLEAFQLESEVDKRAVVRRLLTDDPADLGSFANRMVDPRYRQINQTFGFDDPTKPPLADPERVEAIIRKTLTNRFEKANGEANPGLREAMYFKRMIGTVSDVKGLMGDRVLTAVARTALGLPKQFGLLDYEQQKAILEKRLDPTKFKDPAWVNRFVQRYLTLNEDAAGPASDPRLALFGGGDGTANGLLGLVGATLNLRL
ncbi:DUF1217 domain-containing protein [Elioraea sp.]|uniref:DUF1217 domain-containing protein n=1 Tax=Elioraea sp. TaxID=2185103 RepID=UPI0021DEDDEB|nr:DUF1217 domain-containing protein [Elioraea sp.]GIX11309.1 MAG: hypothetical protein KatS3mg116_3019 [Elioraea sp.]